VISKHSLRHLILYSPCFALTLSGFEKFSVYGFSIDYPAVCRIEFNPKSKREIGDVVFHFPEKEKVFLSWGDLEKAREKFPSVDAQAEHSIKVIAARHEVKNLQRIRQDSLRINSHIAQYNSIQLDEIKPSLFWSGKGITRQAYSLHVHCDNSSRYFVIYTLPTVLAPPGFDELMLKMAKSFKCH
jgi:hypothetical protein